MGTASTSRPIDGDKLYQVRAWKALPVLVRQAKAKATLYYSDLSLELGMPNPRNVNYILGHIGRSLRELAKEWGEEIPPIQLLVANK